MTEKKAIIGKEEWCALPEITLPAIKVRVDSGAKTSSLHAFNIQPFEKEGIKWVQFDIHPLQDDRKIIQTCRAKVVDRRHVKSSSGEKEKRHVIKTPITLGNETWEIEITLTNRDSMGYRMLLGREAMNKRVLIDPDASFCLGKMKEAEVKKLYAMAKPKRTNLNIIILASNPDLYSNKRLMEAGSERGHDIRFADILDCYVSISANKPKVHYRGGEVFDNIDAVIPRIKPAMTFYGGVITRQFQSMGAYCLNDADAIARSRDKLRTLQMLSNNDIDMPATGFASSPLDTMELIKIVGNAPLVVKLLEGTQGKGVVLAETNKAAESVINAFNSLQTNIMVQEFLKEAQGRDIRCFVVDGKVVGSIQREAMEGEFRANLHLGGTAAPVRITSEERRIACKAAKIMGLSVAGVDIIRSKHGPKVVEVNSSPGLEGIEEVTGKDIAGLMIECIEKHVHHMHKT